MVDFSVGLGFFFFSRLGKTQVTRMKILVAVEIMIQLMCAKLEAR